MADLSLELLKELRLRSGAGMMDCKHALKESQGDMEKAIDMLRSQGLAGAAKRAGRAVSEGAIALLCDANRGALVELNCETDFVARNQEFQVLANRLVHVALEQNTHDIAQALDPEAKNRTFAETVQEAAGRLGENLVLRRAHILQGQDDGFIASYVHNTLPDTGVKARLGKIGVLVHVATKADPQALDELGRHIAMHIAANAPLAVDMQGVDADQLARERAVYQAEAEGSGKPAEVIDKIVEGRLKKFLAQSALLEQAFVMDGETPVRKVLQQKAEALKTPIHIDSFVRFALGEAAGGA